MNVTMRLSTGIAAGLAFALCVLAAWPLRAGDLAADCSISNVMALQFHITPPPPPSSTP